MNYEDFLSAVNKPDKYVLVEFWADWCKPCRAMEPMLERFSAERSSGVSLTRINIEGSEGIVEKLNIKGVPTFVLFYHGEIISSFTGALTYDGLNDFIEDAIQYQSNQLNG